MTVPPELKAIVDRAAGREHSAEGSVMRCLAEVLKVHRGMVIAAAEQRVRTAAEHVMNDDSRYNGMCEAADLVRESA